MIEKSAELNLTAQKPIRNTAQAHRDQYETIPGPKEINKILNYGDPADMHSGIDEANRRSLDTLESDPNGNTGVGNVNFARCQLYATLYATRIRDLELKKGREFDPSSLGDLIEEGNMWQKMAEGGELTAKEVDFVRGRALSIRKEFAGAEEETADIEEAKPDKIYSDKEIEAGRRRVARTRRLPTERHDTRDPNDKDSEEKELLDRVPDDSLERSKFANSHFSDFNPDNMKLFKAYLKKEIQGWANRVPENARYPDSLAGILGNGNTGSPHFVQVAVSLRRGRAVELDEIRSIRFSDLASEYLDLDVEEIVPDYFKKFG